MSSSNHLLYNGHGAEARSTVPCVNVQVHHGRWTADGTSSAMIHDGFHKLSLCTPSASQLDIGTGTSQHSRNFEHLLPHGPSKQYLHEH